MINPNLEHFAYLDSTISGHNERLLDRLVIESTGVPVTQTPIGGHDGVRELSGFWRHAREGFRMSFRTESVNNHGINPALLLNATRSGDTQGIWEEINSIGFATERVIDTSAVAPGLAVFGHALVTISLLDQLGDVSIATLDPPLRGRRLGHLGQQHVDWKRNLNPETLWGMLDQLKRDTSAALFTKGSFDRQTIAPALRAAQFFAAGVNLTRGMRAA